MTDDATTADIYVRKSTADGGKSIRAQEDEGRDACLDAGWEVGRVFADDNRSASRYARRVRESFAELQQHIRSGACRLLVVWEASRASRDLAEFVGLLDELARNRVLLHVVSHGKTYDPSRSMDYKALATEGIDARHESERISERTLRGKRAAAREGKPSGRTVYGFRRVFDENGAYTHTELVAERAAVVREIVRRIGAGDELSGIARDLTQRGIATPTGIPAWRAGTVRNLALNPAIAGWRVHRGSVVGPGAWPAIVDDAQWRKARAILSDPSRVTHHGIEVAWLLSGAMRCGRCESGRLRAHRDRYQCAACNKIVIAGRPLDAWMEELVLARLSRPDALAAFTARPDDAALTAVSATLEDLRGELDDAYRRAKDRRLSAAGLASIEAGLLPAIEAAERERDRLAVPPALADLAGVDVSARWPRWSMARRRDVVMALADIVVGPARIGVPRFDPARLGGSRWRGDTRTWAEL